MLLNELTDQQIAGAFIDQDPLQRRKNNALNPQQLSMQNGKQQTLDRQSKDPLTLRIAALRSQLAQLMVQQQKQQKVAATKAGPVAATTPGAPVGASLPGSTNPRQ